MSFFFLYGILFTISRTDSTVTYHRQPPSMAMALNAAAMTSPRYLPRKAANLHKGNPTPIRNRPTDPRSYSYEPVILHPRRSQLSKLFQFSFISPFPSDCFLTSPPTGGALLLLLLMGDRETRCH